ncbi:MAG: hypothetical protein JW991_03605 [Candidatus Pacebacteria bacterium]|nr:hypothetical protein [Candidatus Paceibacterota bacterium]
MKLKKTLNQLFFWGSFFVLTLFLELSPVSGWSQTDQPAQIYDLEFVFRRVVMVVTTLAGMGVLVMFVIGGFQYLTAGEDPKQAQKASGTLTYAVIGLAVILAAWLILQAIKLITGLNVTIFTLPEPTN